MQGSVLNTQTGAQFYHFSNHIVGRLYYYLQILQARYSEVGSRNAEVGILKSELGRHKGQKEGEKFRR